MKRPIHLSLILGLSLVVACGKDGSGSDNPPGPTVKIPTVTTASVTSVTKNSASCGGNVTSDGGASVTVCGVVWSKSQNPTVESCSGKTADGSGTGVFTSSLTELSSSTTYYVRAYAINSAGTSYGEEKSCTTQSPSPGESTDLSAGGTANCYVVSAAGKYKFKATVKGSTSESVGSPSSAEVLWESFGTDVQPEVGDIINTANFHDGYIYFTTPTTLANGNAVIAVKDASGNILWSWHIWVCKGFDPVATAQVYNHNAGTMMDRNLGATSATMGSVKSFGLLYQWGRKDPFLSGDDISSTTIAKSTGTWPSATESTASTGTFAYAVQHPMQFITCNSNNYDWYYSNDASTDNTRWQTSDKSKGLYDPCPVGWRVPDGGTTGVWCTAFDTTIGWTTKSNWDGTHKGMDFGKTDRKLVGDSSAQCWYPAAGCRSRDDGSLGYVGDAGYYWSCTPTRFYACNLFFYLNGGVLPSYDYYRAFGQSVRCLSESEVR